MGIIPEQTKRAWHRNAKARNTDELSDLLEFRDILIENTVSGKPRHPIGQLYAEAAESMLLAQNTLERKMRTIREYTAKQLNGWIGGGLSFDHIENANDFQEYPPAVLLHAAIELGARNGNKPMTVAEMITFANGGEPPKQTDAKVTKAFDYLRKIPYWLGLTDEWKDEFLSDVETLWQKWQKRIAK